MSHFKTIIFLLILFLTLSACKRRGNEVIYGKSGNGNEYAKYFRVSGQEGQIEFDIIDSWSSGKENICRYSITKAPDDSTEAGKITRIEYPIKRVVCMSTSHIAYMRALGLENLIVGVSGKQYISDQKILNSIERGEISDVGYEGSLNYELLLRLKPDVVFTYGILGENNVYIDKIKELGIDVIALGDYLEDHPIGKLEYLKLFGKLFNCSRSADSIYNSVKERYFSLNEVVSNADFRPKVLLNAPWKEVWYIPGNNNYMSVLIKDAGGDPVLSKDGESKSISYNLEEVYQKAMIADFWLNPNNFSTIDELKNSNPLFKNIPSLKSGKVYNNTKKETLQGGSDFWEKGVIEPDVILNDLINILHPEICSNRELIYYKKLN
ncbi:MAG: ABC transporter substrate-binding protein [Rikenellaceae bacterium]